MIELLPFLGLLGFAAALLSDVPEFALTEKAAGRFQGIALTLYLMAAIIILAEVASHIRWVD